MIYPLMRGRRITHLGMVNILPSFGYGTGLMMERSMEENDEPPVRQVEAKLVRRRCRA